MSPRTYHDHSGRERCYQCDAYPSERCSHLAPARRLKKAAEEAQLAFWARLVELLPECKTGDFPPEACFAFDQACEQAVEVWHSFNAPEGEEGSS